MANHRKLDATPRPDVTPGISRRKTTPDPALVAALTDLVPQVDALIDTLLADLPDHVDRDAARIAAWEVLSSTVARARAGELLHGVLSDPDREGVTRLASEIAGLAGMSNATALKKRLLGTQHRA